MPELPDNIAIAGRKIGKQYLYRPGELVCRTRDLERNKEDLLGVLEDEFGAQRVEAPPSRMSSRDHALHLVDREPEGDAVRQACASLLHSGKRPRDPLEVLRSRLTASFKRLGEREEVRRQEAQRTLERQGATMLLLPPWAPPVPKILKELRRTRNPQTTRIWANQVFSTEQDWEWVPSIPARRLGHRLPESPAGGSAGRGVRVGVVDTGVRLAHAWLASAQAGNDDYEELDENRDLVLDFEAGHGTFVAGVVLQLAPAATIFGRAAVDSNGFTDDVRVAAAIDTLGGLGIDVLNLSVGGSADSVAPAPSTRSALNRLRHDNPRLTVVAAAGNRNSTDLFYPAAFPDVIAVGALGPDQRRAAFSNHGPWVNAWALGVDLQSCYVGTDVTATPATDPPGSRDGAVWSGTSFAAPRVAGAIAAAMRPGS